MNLYARRSTASRGLGTRPEHVGPANDAWIRNAAAGRAVVCAWGPKPHIAGRVRAVRELLVGRGATAYRIGPAAKDGSPCHPLMLAYARTLELLGSADGPAAGARRGR